MKLVEGLRRYTQNSCSATVCLENTEELNQEFQRTGTEDKEDKEYKVACSSVKQERNER